MELNTYQQKALETAMFPVCLVGSSTSTGILLNRPASYIYPALGLVGEAGEVAEKIKKLIRDKDGKYDFTDREAIKKELGDVLWYIAVLAEKFNLMLDDVAQLNIDKLSSRKERGKLNGSGDDR